MRSLIITNTITPRGEKSLEKYLKDIARYEVLSPEQENRLFNLYQSGDKEALNRILEHNLRFVVSVAKQYQFNGLSLNDLVNEGNIGLIKAAQRFDPSKGFKFISYTVWWIRQQIIVALQERSRKIRLPMNKQVDQKRIERCRDSLQQKLGRQPSTAEIARAADLSVDAVENLMRVGKFCKSLDAPSPNHDGLDLKGMITDSKIAAPDTRLVEEESRKTEVALLLNQLSKREQLVMSMYYGIGRDRSFTLDAIGNKLDISRERVRQIQYKALLKMRRRAAV